MVFARFTNDCIYVLVLYRSLCFYLDRTFIFGGESVKLYLTTASFFQTDDDKISISSRLEESILKIMRPYLDRIIMEEKRKLNTKNLERQQMIQDELKKVLQNAEN